MLRVAFALALVASPALADDFSWLTANNPQPASLLQSGPVTWSLYVDSYYSWQFRRPIDHAIFPTSTAPLHDEIALNLAHLGVDVTGLDGAIGRLYVQSVGDVPSVQQASVGWHWNALSGINAEVGILPSYIGLDSYLPEENWSYTHAFMADFTPYFLTGARAQVFLTPRMKVELWLVNGWESGRGGGYLWNWRPREWLSITHTFYAGRDVQIYSDNHAQVRYYRGDFPRALAVAVSLDAGHERRFMGGAQVAHHIEWTSKLRTALRADIFDDVAQTISTKFPAGTTDPWPGTGKLVVGGGSITMDYWPSPWLLARLEYAHRTANQPYFTAHDGLPSLAKHDDRIVLDLTLRL